MFSNDRNLLTVMNRIKLEGRNIVQVLAETEYQDLYRITDGVLLVINKFKPIDYGGRQVCFAV